MEDEMGAYDLARLKRKANEAGVPLDIYTVYNKIVSGYENIQVKNRYPKSQSGASSQADQMSHEFDQMAFKNWVDVYKVSAQEWLDDNKFQREFFPKNNMFNFKPDGVNQRVMTGEELIQVWDWFVKNYEDATGNKFNGADDEHWQALPLAGEQTNEWRSKQHTSPPPDSEEDIEPEPEQSAEAGTEEQPWSDRQPSDKEDSILSDIHRLLKRGKSSGGRVRNYLPLAGVYDPGGSQGDRQIAGDTETLLELISMLRSLSKSMNTGV